MIALLLLSAAWSAPIDLQEVSVNAKQFFGGGRYEPLIAQSGLPNRTLGKELNLNVNLELFRYFYWDNLLHSLTDKDTLGGREQFRVVGWQYRLGVHALDCLDIGYEHYSQHLLDYTEVSAHYPLQDAIEATLYLYAPGRKGKGLIP